jgi:glutamyl-tRNA synthetase
VIRGRFAPSPTGRLHLGNARSALLGWLDVRSRGGEFVLRIEDLDPQRSSQAAIDGIFEDLEWLGLTWDGPVLHQSARGEVYDAALEQLQRAGRVYPCWCSRAEVARAASAPHPGDDGPVYPGTCRSSPVPRVHRTPALRFMVEPGLEVVHDALAGEFAHDVSTAVGDFVVRRSDGVASYQLAVVVDDAAQGITDVLRGDDLLASTPRQLQLFRALSAAAPRFAHVPLLVQPDGRRLAKREGAATVAALREQGWSAERVVGVLAEFSGLGDGQPVPARALVPGFSLERVARGPTVVDEAALR